MSEISQLEQNLIIRKIDSETINIQVSNNQMLLAIVGQFDQNLKELEKLTRTNIFFRGNSITCKGNKANIDVFSNAIEFLANKFSTIWLRSLIVVGNEILLSKKLLGIKELLEL